MKHIKYFAPIILILMLSGQTFGFQAYEALWTGILKRHTEMGSRHNITARLVDYPSIKESQSFQTILRVIEGFDISSLKTKEEKLAFWINVYNIAAVKMIVDHYPLNSIRDKSGLFHKVWDIRIINVGGTDYSLGHIEHQILRKLGEPGIHFAIVCASMSCPDLREEAYTSEKIDEQLSDQARQFLSNSRKGLKSDDNVQIAYISRIFDWFKDDFKSKGGVKKFLNDFSEKDVTFYKIDYLKYNWDLNELK